MLSSLTIRWTEATRSKSQAQQLLLTLVRFTAVILLAMGVFGVVLLLFGKNPVEVYVDIFSSTLGNSFGRSEIVVKMIPLLLCATAVMLPARIGLVNVGGEGQLYLGAWLAAGGALLLGGLGLPQVIALPAVILLGFIGGGLWAAIPAVFRAKGWLNETISTLLLNYVAILFVGYFIFGPWKDPNSGNFPQTAQFTANVLLPRFGETRIHWGLMLAVTAVIGLYIVFKYTRWGYEMRAIGGNPEAARRHGISIKRYIITNMFVAGGLAGLAGTCEVLAIQGRLIPGFSPGYGYLGFLISWLALHNPIGIVVMSFLVAIISAGGDTLQITQNMPFASVNILMGLILFIVLADLFKPGENIMIISFIVGVLVGAIQAGTSILYAAEGEVLVERAGVINLGLEGTMLMGASVGFMVVAQTGNAFLGLVAAALAGGLFNLILAWLVVTRGANQLASGLALGFFGIGLSALLGKAYVGQRAVGLQNLPIPVLSEIPYLGRVFFNHDILTYLVIPLALFMWWVLFKTRWGLFLRSVGESKNVAFTAGLKPKIIQYQALFLGGLLAGIGGAHLSLAFAGSWTEGMVAGRGFITVALVIFASWHPIRAIAGALLFGGAMAFQLQLQARGAPISPFILDMIPYMLTLVVLLYIGNTVRSRNAMPHGLQTVFEGMS